MPIKVKNVKVNEIKFKDFKNFDKCLEYVKSMNIDPMKYLPQKPQQHLQFEITNTVSDFANCIRRFLLDEIYIYSMDVDEMNIITNDRFILSDVLKKNIELIPIDQLLTDEFVISLQIENKTDDIMTIHSGDITITNKNKVLKTSDYFSSNIPIIQLRSNCSLEIKNISIVSGCGKQDAGKFCLLSNISYEILDVMPVEVNKYEKKGESSLNSEPAHFKIGFKTYRNFDPKKIMLLCCDAITNRMTTIQKELSNITKDMTVYFSDLINLETKGDIKLFHFKNEYWTIANIISRYCYLEFKEIKFICACIIHPSTEESIVKITHPESNKIIDSAITQILDDIKTLRKSFE